jgi:hypothetical protein
MDHLIKLYAGEQFIQRSAIRQIAVDELEWFGERLDVVKIATLDRRVVEIVQFVERPDGMSRAEQTLAHMGTNETCAASDQKIHERDDEVREPKFKAQSCSVNHLWLT